MRQFQSKSDLPADASPSNLSKRETTHSAVDQNELQAAMPHTVQLHREIICSTSVLDNTSPPPSLLYDVIMKTNIKPYTNGKQYVF